MGILEDCFAEVEDGGEVVVHLVLQLDNLLVRQLVFGVVEDFFGEHFEDVEVVFADVHVLHGGRADLVDEVGPGSVPLVLDNLDQYAITF